MRTVGRCIGVVLGLVLGCASVVQAQTITNDMNWGVSPGADDYLVERDADGAGFAQVAVVAAPQTSYQDALLPTGPVYTWRVSARNVAGTSAPSNACSTVTVPPPPPGSLTCTVTFNP